MTRSHAHRAAAAALALGVLALTGCGNATEGTAQAGAPSSAAGSTSPSASASASPSAAPVKDGIDDPRTGLDGTQPEGNCSWVTAEQLGDLAPASTKALRGVLTQQPIDNFPGTMRACLLPIDKESSMSVGTLNFDTQADLDAYLKSTENEAGNTPVAGEPGASFYVFKSPTLVGQSLARVDGTSVRYITYRSMKDTAKIVKNEPVPTPNRLEQLKAAHSAVFG